jgi:hypothetical protein
MIQIHEKAPIDIVEIEEGKETEEFIKIWFDSIEKFNHARFSEIYVEMNNIYKDVLRILIFKVDITLRMQEEELKQKYKTNLDNLTGKFEEDEKPRKAFFT